jgi:hypothetical protein
MKRHEKLLREAEQLERDALEAEARGTEAEEEAEKTMRWRAVAEMRNHEAVQLAAKLRHKAEGLREEAARLRQKANEEMPVWTAWLKGGAYDGVVIDLPALVEKIVLFCRGKAQEYAHKGPANDPECDAPNGGIWFYHQPPRNPE